MWQELLPFHLDVNSGNCEGKQPWQAPGNPSHIPGTEGCGITWSKHPAMPNQSSDHGENKTLSVTVVLLSLEGFCDLAEMIQLPKGVTRG